MVPLGTALVVLFTLIGTGVLVLDKYSTSIYTDVTINESVKVTSNGSTDTLNYDKGDGANLVSGFTLYNKSGSTAVTSSLVSVTVTDLGVVTLTEYCPANCTGCINSGVNCYATYTVKNASGTVNDVIDAGSTSLGDINDTWGSLLITIIILVLILTLLLTALYPIISGRR